MYEESEDQKKELRSMPEGWSPPGQRLVFFTGQKRKKVADKRFTAPKKKRKKK